MFKPSSAVRRLAYRVAEGLAFAALLSVWYFFWMATPAGAAGLNYAPPTNLAFARGSIFLGMMLLGIAFLMVLATKPQQGGE